MDIVVSTLLVGGAPVVWLVLAGTLALLAGRVIHERDAHDRPVLHRRPLTSQALVRKRPVPQH